MPRLTRRTFLGAVGITGMSGCLELGIHNEGVPGFVGADGIGYYLIITIKRLQYGKLLTAIIAVFVLVVLSDNLSGAATVEARITDRLHPPVRRPP